MSLGLFCVRDKTLLKRETYLIKRINDHLQSQDLHNKLIMSLLIRLAKISWHLRLTQILFLCFKNRLTQLHLQFWHILLCLILLLPHQRNLRLHISSLILLRSQLWLLLQIVLLGLPEFFLNLLKPLIQLVYLLIFVHEKSSRELARCLIFGLSGLLQLLELLVVLGYLSFVVLSHVLGQF